MGKSQYNSEIFIHTAKNQYVSGEFVTGAILLRVGAPIPAKSLVLKIKGKEVVEFEDHETHTHTNSDGTTRSESVVVWRHIKRDIFKQVITLLNYPGGFVPGCYAYPFNFQLPADLPGTFHKKKMNGNPGYKYKASIFYKAKAVLDIPGTKHDLKVTQPFVIHQSFSTGTGPKFIEKEGTVMFLCCVPRGKVFVKASIDKDSYIGGETARIHVEVQNNSKVNIDHFASKLFRVTDLSTGAHHRRITDEVTRFKKPGIPPGETASTDIDLPLFSRKHSTKAISPGTKSPHIKCRYYVSIEMQVPWAPDICIEVPVTIMPPINQSWVNFAAPVWASQCQVQMVDPRYCMPVQDAGNMMKHILGDAFKAVFLEYR
eukprot:Colp12_sorted_trinity150504_noHs@22383